MAIKPGDRVTLHGEEAQHRVHIVKSVDSGHLLTARCGRKRWLTAVGLPMPGDMECEVCLSPLEPPTSLTDPQLSVSVSELGLGAPANIALTGFMWLVHGVYSVIRFAIVVAPAILVAVYSHWIDGLLLATWAIPAIAWLVGGVFLYFRTRMRQ